MSSAAIGHAAYTTSSIKHDDVGSSPVTGEFPAQRPVTQSFDDFFDLRLIKRLSKQSWGWWFETQPLPLWRHRNDLAKNYGTLSLFAIPL